MRKKKYAGVLVFVCLFAFFGVLVAQDIASPFEKQPSVNIDFSTYPDGALKSTDWDFFVGEPVYNNEQETYTNQAENVRVENGTLVIQALKTEKGYTSAKISPMANGEKLAFQGGKIEIVAKLPKGAGTWPAFWLLSADEKYTKSSTDEQWAADPNLWAKNGEIDLMEATGDNPEQVSSDVHTYTTVKAESDPNVSLVQVANASGEFHTYGLEWTAQEMTFTIDSKAYHTVKKSADWPFDQSYYLMLNLAMGGSMGGPVADKSSANWILSVKSIKYWPLKASK